MWKILNDIKTLLINLFRIECVRGLHWKMTSYYGIYTWYNHFIFRRLQQTLSILYFYLFYLSPQKNKYRTESNQKINKKISLSGQKIFFNFPNLYEVLSCSFNLFSDFVSRY